MKMNPALPFWAHSSGDQGCGIRVLLQTQNLGFSGFGDDNKVLLEHCDLKGNAISWP